MKLFDAIETTDKINYSVDILDLIDDNKLTKSKVYTYIGRLINGDFGTLDQEKQYRFKPHIEKGDKDIYGIYDDIIIYYDASTDEIDVVTKNEFMTYYKADWQNFNRDDGKTRMSTKQPQKQLKEGQRHEIIKEATEKYDKPVGLQMLLRKGYEVYPYEDYTAVAKMLGTERLNKFRELANMRGVPVKKLLAIFAHLHSVSNYNIQDAYEWVLRHINDKYIFTTDAKDATDYESVTKQGYKIVDLITIGNRKFIIGKRKYDYFVGAGYDVNNGTWAQGYYDFDNVGEAVEFIQDHYRTGYYQD